VAIRPVWQDLITQDYNGRPELQFDTESPFLTLLNHVVRDGTRHNAGNMNNMFYFSNLLALRGTKYVTAGLGTSTIIEEVRENLPAPDDRLIARNTSTSSNAGNTWVVREELWDVNEFEDNVIVQDRTITYNKVGNNWEAVVS